MFRFAWVDEGEDFETVQDRTDEHVLGLEIVHGEGDFALAKVTLKNPRVPWLAPGRKVWCWIGWAGVQGQQGGPLYYSDGSIPDDPITPVPLLHGRLLAIPSDLHAEAVTVDFIARPSDFVDRKETAAEALRTLPEFDPIFVQADRLSDPDAVLDGRSALWHIDPVTHEVTVSDVLEGEGGLVVIDPVLYDSVKTSLENVPLRRVHVEAQIDWQQRAHGNLDITGKLLYAWHGNGAQPIRSLLKFSGWPGAGASIGSGWKVAHSVFQSMYPDPEIESHQARVTMEPPKPDEVSGTTYTTTSMSYSWQVLGPVGYRLTLYEPVYTRYKSDESRNPDTRELTGWSVSSQREGAILSGWAYRIGLSVEFTPNRTQHELIRFTLESDMQPVVTLPEEDEVLTLTLQSQSVSQTVPPLEGEERRIVSEDFPIKDASRSSYITTARGTQTLEYLLLVARAHLRANARVITIAFETTMECWLQTSLRHNAQVDDGRLPGGTAVGKIIERKLSMDGGTGRLVCAIRMGCAVGYGGVKVPVPGVPQYASTDYMTADYQRYEGGTRVPIDDLAYTPPEVNPQDDGIRFGAGGGSLWHTGETPLVTVTALRNMTNQLSRINQLRSGWKLPDWLAGTQTFPVNEYMNVKSIADAHKTKIGQAFKDEEAGFRIRFRPLDGDWVSVYDIEVEPLLVPQMINLEAAP